MKQEIKKVDAVCVICGPSETVHEYSVVEHEYPDTTNDVFNFVRCKECRLVFLSPRPANEELGTIYPPNYYAFDLADAGSGDNGLSVKSLSRRFDLRRTKALLRRHHSEPVSSVFDIGCGDGFDLDVFRSVLGETVLTAGVEMSEAAASRARLRGHQVVAGLFNELDTRDAKYDIVVSKHVIEHVDDPRAFLEKAKRLTASTGILIIDTPNVDSPLRHLFGRHWGGWHTPRHWYLFSPRTFTDLAESCGLKVAAIHQMPINMYWIWGLHSALFKNHRRIADKFFDPVGVNKAGARGILLLSLFQLFELALKLITRRTSQMRVVLKHAE